MFLAAHVLITLGLLAAAVMIVRASARSQAPSRQLAIGGAIAIVATTAAGILTMITKSNWWSYTNGARLHRVAARLRRPAHAGQDSIAARWLRAQPVAQGRPVILYGVSRGAEGALLIASYEPHLFNAVIASSPSSEINGAYGGKPGPAWTFQGKPLPTETPIPVGQIRVPLLLGDGGQDAIWDSALSATIIMQELRAANDPAPYINLCYPRAGHAFLGTPPYFPYSGYGAHGLLGGTQQANALAEEQSWVTMINFLNDPWQRVT